MNDVNGITVTVKYAPVDCTLTIHYVYADNNNEAAPDAVSTVKYDAAYSVDSPAITGYTPDIATVSGTMRDVNGVEVTVKYAANPYILTINYVMSDGSEAPAAHTETLTIGAPYSVTSPAVDGFTVESGKEVVAGTMPADDVTVTVNYSINSYTVKFVVPAAPYTHDANNSTVVDITDDATYTVIAGAQPAEFKSAITAPAQPDMANYTSEGWAWFNADTGASISALAAVPAYNVIVVAQYTRVPVTLDVVPEGTSIVLADDPTAEFTGYIFGVEPGVTVAQFLQNYAEVTGDGQVLTPTPVEAYASYGKCGTGTKIELYDNVTQSVIATYYIVIYGDVNGDGIISSLDPQAIRREVSSASADGWSVDNQGNWLDPSAVAAPRMLAADLNGDGQITSADTNIAKAIVSGMAEINQATGEVTYY